MSSGQDLVPNNLLVAFRSLSQRKMRTFLTALGLIIGVAAVVTMVSAGQAASAQVKAQIDSLGTNLIIISPTSQVSSGASAGAGSRQSLTVADAQAMARDCHSILLVCPTAKASVPVSFGNKNWQTFLQGCSPEYLTIRDWNLLSGLPFSKRHVQTAAKVCLIGTVLSERLFEEADPVGRTIRVKGELFRVMGLLEPKGQSSSGQDQDDTLLAPYTTVQRRFLGIRHLHSILASAVSPEEVDTAVEEVTGLLRRRHKIRKDELDDFRVRSQTEMTDAADQATGVMTILLGGIASVSLLVGGIGIMNIMLVSVNERTREIGVRMAVGARGRDILSQFLAEAVTVCAFGGIPGALLGWGGAALISRAFGWPIVVEAGSLLLALGFSVAIGLFFGIYPAWRASRLDPVECLRHE